MPSSMEYTVVRVTGPESVLVGSFHDEDAAAAFARQRPEPEGVYHEVRAGGRVLWTSEGGELERVV